MAFARCGKCTQPNPPHRRPECPAPCGLAPDHKGDCKAGIEIKDVHFEIEGEYDVAKLSIVKCAAIHEKTGKQCELWDCKPDGVHINGPLHWKIGGYQPEVDGDEETVVVGIDMHKRVDDLALQIGYEVLRRWLG